MAATVREVTALIETWRPGGCKTEEAFERSLVKHLKKKLKKSDITQQYAAGQVKGDIVVDGKILVEIEGRVNSKGKLQHLLEQLDAYASKWEGKIIVVICGKSQRSLLKILRDKVDSLQPVPNLLKLFPEQKIVLLVKQPDHRRTKGPGARPRARG
jgi:nitrate reductase NapAB chaperone NapD